MSDLPPPEGMCVCQFSIGAEDYLVLCWDLDDFTPSDALTAAERQVALALVRGWSLARIAHSRGRSQRTIANQARAIYRKLGARSRLELGLRMRRTR